jgi:signal transduction histidine kinase
MQIREQMLRRYGFAGLSVVTALLLSLLLQPLTRETNFLLFVAAVMISAWYGGLVAGLLATLLAVLVSSYFLLPPLYALNLADPDDVAHLALFMLVAILISSLHHKVRTAQQRAEELARDREELLSREQQARLAAEAAARSRDEFIAMVSHELRTPITAILGWAEMLKRFGDRDTSSAAQILEAIERNAKRQALLINDLLDSSRIMAGKLHLDLRPVDLSTVIYAALEIARPAADAKQIQVQVMIAPDQGLVSGDSSRLEQVMWNLLTNAIKFTPCGGRVEIHLNRSDSYLEIAVCDTGKGIPAEFLPFVFERFSQFGDTDARRQGGLGLGLAIARHVVELHGGTIEAESPGEGRGSTFKVRLPALAVTSDRPGVEMRQIESLYEQDDMGRSNDTRQGQHHAGGASGIHSSICDWRTAGRGFYQICPCHPGLVIDPL